MSRRLAGSNPDCAIRRTHCAPATKAASVASCAGPGACRLMRGSFAISGATSNYAGIPQCF